jgi:hypothetical protein
MTMASDTSQYERSYRERDVDETLTDHEQRLSRLEKVALIGIGYGLASGAQIITEIGQFL